MPLYKVEGLYCDINYELTPDDDFVEEFTQKKRRIWSPIGSGIDDYIETTIIDIISKSIPYTRVAAMETFESDEFRRDLSECINQEINRGLAIIAHDPVSIVVRNTHRQIVDKDGFERAFRRLLSEYGFSRRAQRNRAIQARQWADAVAHNLITSFERAVRQS